MIEGKEMLELILRRQSDRKYSDKPIETDKLERIIEAGRMAPSACNAQPWKFIVVTDPPLIGKLAEAASAKLLGMNVFVGQAPVIIASENICLQSAAEGVGSCIIGWFDEEQIRKILDIPASKRVELIITLGYSMSEYRQKKRKPREETASYNKY
jgi:nitroreductase